MSVFSGDSYERDQPQYIIEAFWPTTQKTLPERKLVVGEDNLKRVQSHLDEKIAKNDSISPVRYHIYKVLCEMVVDSSDYEKIKRLKK